MITAQYAMPSSPGDDNDLIQSWWWSQRWLKEDTYIFVLAENIILSSTLRHHADRQSNPLQFWKTTQQLPDSFSVGSPLSKYPGLVSPRQQAYSASLENLPPWMISLEDSTFKQPMWTFQGQWLALSMINIHKAGHINFWIAIIMDYFLHMSQWWMKLTHRWDDSNS